MSLFIKIWKCLNFFAARRAAASLFPITGGASNAPLNASHYLSLHRLFLSFSNLHVLRAPEPFLRTAYEEVSCPKEETQRSHNSENYNGADNGRPDNNANYNGADNGRPAELSVDQRTGDHFSLMGQTDDENRQAFHRYVTRHFLSKQNGGDSKQNGGDSAKQNGADSPIGNVSNKNSKHPEKYFYVENAARNYSLEDFKGDGFCEARRRESYGSRQMLSKILLTKFQDISS